MILFEECQATIFQAINGSIDRDRIIERIDRQQGSASILPAIDGLPVQTFMEGVQGLNDPNRVFLLFMNLLELVEPLKGNVPEHFTLGFRFPASQVLSSAAAYSSFWLEMLGTIIEDVDMNPTLFWRLSGANNLPTSSLLTFLRQPTAKVFFDMIPVERESDYICDMIEINEHKLDRAGSIIPSSLKSTLESSGALMRDLLYQLH